MKKIYAFLFISFMLCHQGYTQVSLVSQFDFNGNLNDNLSTSSASLTNMAATAYINGVLNFTANATNQGGGIGLTIPDAAFTENDYSIAIDLKLSEAYNYAKVIDFQDQQADYGLYFEDNTLNLYNLDYGTTYIQENVFYTVLLTRRASDDSVKVYLIQNNTVIAEIEDEDEDEDFVPILVGSDRVFHLFLDDTGSEYADSGAVRSVRIWNGQVNINDVCNSIVSSTTSPASGTLCANDNATITLNGSPTVFTSYTLNPSASIGSTIVVSPSVTSTYTISGDYYSTGCHTPTAAVTLTVLTPTLSVASTTSLLCSGQTATLSAGGSASSYSWSTGSTSSLISVSPTVSTTYTLIGFNGSCEANLAFTQSVTICAGLEDLSLENKIVIYPNPSNGVFTIESNLDSGNAELLIYNSVGQLVVIEKLKTASKIDLSNQTKGIYFVKIVKDNHLIYSGKVLTQ